MLTEHLSSEEICSLPGELARRRWCSPDVAGGPLRVGLFVRRHFKRTVCGYEKANGEKVPGALPERLAALRFHDLRHTCAALSIAAGPHPKLISARLGHSSITITLDRYGHLFPRVEEALADALDAAFNSPTESAQASVEVSAIARRK
jgi:integrase